MKKNSLYATNQLLPLLVCAFLLLLVACQTDTDSNRSSASNEQQENVNTNLTEDSLNTPPPLPDYFYKRMQGKIGNQKPIQVHLIRSDLRMKGHYYTNISGTPRPFVQGSQIDDEEYFQLVEQNLHPTTKTATGSNNNSAIFKGYFLNKEEIKGMWSDKNSNAPIAFSLKESYPPGSAYLDIKTHFQQYGDCDKDKEKDSECLIIDIVYPQVFDNVTETSRVSVNEQIQKDVFDILGWPNASNIENLVDSLINEYKSLSKEFGNTQTKWTYDLDYNIMNNTANILSICLQLTAYTGGTNAEHSNMCFNFNLATGKPILFPQLFPDDALKKISRLAEQKLRTIFKLKKDVNLGQSGFYEENFQVSEQYYFTPKGIVLAYNPDEIAPKEMGIPSIFIGFEEMKDYMVLGE